MLSALLGPLLIAVAAFLWATDSLFRVPSVGRFDPTVVVLVEHAIGTACVLPFAWFRNGSFRKLTSLPRADWLALGVIGIGGSAAATVLFTASFLYINPSVTILLQKLQPILVVLLARVFLGEKPHGAFLGWAAAALVSGAVMSFPDLNFGFLGGGLDLHSKGVLYAVSAATLWAVSTIAGKRALRDVSPSIVTFWRYAFGFVALGLLIALTGRNLPLAGILEPASRNALLYMGLIPGLFAMLLYYTGLSTTPASLATFVELVFPVSAVILNTLYLGAALLPVQVVAGAVLLVSVTQASRTARR